MINIIKKRTFLIAISFSLIIVPLIFVQEGDAYIETDEVLTIDDTYTSEASPNVAYGSWWGLEMYPNYWSVCFGKEVIASIFICELRAFFKFNLSQCPKENVTSIILELKTGVSAPYPDFELWIVGNDWNGDTLTWNTEPSWIKKIKTLEMDSVLEVNVTDELIGKEGIVSMGLRLTEEETTKRTTRIFCVDSIEHKEDRPNEAFISPATLMCSFDNGLPEPSFFDGIFGFLAGIIGFIGSCLGIAIVKSRKLKKKDRSSPST